MKNSAQQFFCIALLLSTLHVGNSSMAAEQVLDYDTLVQNAMNLRNAGNMSEAEVALRQAWEIASNKSEASYLLGLVVAFQERYAEAIAILDAALIDYPQDTNLLLAKARVRSYQGVLQEAEVLTQGILNNQPDNQEARNLSGRIALYQRRPAHARTLFTQVLQSHPDDLEALIGLYDTELVLGNREEAGTLLAKAAQIAPGHIDVLSRQSAAAMPGTPKHAWITGYERSRMDTAGQHWHDRFVEYRHRYSIASEQSLRLSHNHRFGEHDTSIDTSLLLRQQSSVPVELGLSYTPDAHFMPEHSLRASMGFRLSEGSDTFGSTFMNTSFQSARYSTGNTLRGTISADHYLRNIDAWLSAGIGLVRDENSTNIGGWQFGAHWQTTANARIGFTYSEGGETENAITTRTRSVSGYMAYSFDTRWQLQLNVSESRRERSYTRESIALTLQYRY
ncbi:MAG: YaiO family outer membrane beta-barrel protein [Gammaproteobacteria bacterium]|nr:YaiO family outer membrane beta-barrel protein [Gammaproteobacteria bacterium]MDP2347922.1 YaiO family outer membrane beta-barrel protein [Gammaproteobacteria bacterium]